MIVAAAVKRDGQVYSLPRPARHHDVLRSLGRGNRPGDVQGFVDEVGAFLTRLQAYQVACDRRQLLRPELHPRVAAPGRLLFSEDVW